MKRIVCSLVAIIMATMIIASCTQSSAGGENVDPTTGSLMIQLPGTARAVSASDIDRFTIDITAPLLSYSKSLTGVPGQTLKIENLVPGSYDVVVKAFDDALPALDRLVFTGSNSAVVTVGQTASVSITLVPAVGDLSISVSFPSDPSMVAKQRFKGVKNDWAIAYATYDANGIITKIENFRQDTTTVPRGYKLDSTIEYQFSDTFTRSGATVKNASGVVIETATIAHDASGNETSIAFTTVGTTSGYTIDATYNTDKSAIIELAKTYSGGTTPVITRSFYDNGDMKSVQIYWGVFLGDKIFQTSGYESPERTHKVIASYDPVTRIPVQFDHYANGVIVDTENRTLAPSGFYQKAEHKRSDGSMISTVIYGNPIIVGDYYAQPVTRVYFGDPNDSNYIDGSLELSYSYYQLFSKTFQPAGTSGNIKTFEEGSVRPGIINPLYLESYY